MWFPIQSGSNSGHILLDDGCTQIKATLHPKAKAFAKAHPEIGHRHCYYLVYPRTEGTDSFLRLVVRAIYLRVEDADIPLDGRLDRFTLKGKILNINPLSVRIQQNVECGKRPGFHFNINFLRSLYPIPESLVDRNSEIIAYRVRASLEALEINSYDHYQQQ